MNVAKLLTDVMKVVALNLEITISKIGAMLTPTLLEKVNELEKQKAEIKNQETVIPDSVVLKELKRALNGEHN